MEPTLKNRPKFELRDDVKAVSLEVVHILTSYEKYFEDLETELRKEKATLERYGFTDREDYILIKKLLGEA